MMFTMTKFGNRHRINHQIKSFKIRLIYNNVQMGIVTLDNALRFATDKSLDLVEIAPNANPPVCYVVDYNKYLYDNKVKQKKQHKDDLKEIRFKSCIEQHDLDIKIKQARSFLEKSKKLQITLKFRSFRDLNHKEIGFNLIKKFLESIQDLGSIEKEPSTSANSIVCRVTPKNKNLNSNTKKE